MMRSVQFMRGLRLNGSDCHLRNGDKLTHNCVWSELVLNLSSTHISQERLQHGRGMLYYRFQGFHCVLDYKLTSSLPSNLLLR